MIMDILKSGAERIGLTLSPAQLNRFDIYRAELQDWNRRINLTGIMGERDIQIKHFLDALTLYRIWPRTEFAKGLRIIDIGTGGGIPGIPLKIAFPEINLALLEANRKKAVFLKYIIVRLGLDNVEVINNRAECAAYENQYRERFHMVLARAVAPLVTLLELALPFCMVGGRFIAQKKGEIAEELERAIIAIGLLGGRLRDVVNIELNELSDQRKLIVVYKESATPMKYPRRPGIPSKRPLA